MLWQIHDREEWTVGFDAYVVSTREIGEIGREIGEKGRSNLYEFARRRDDGWIGSFSDCYFTLSYYTLFLVYDIF